MPLSDATRQLRRIPRLWRSGSELARLKSFSNVKRRKNCMYTIILKACLPLLFGFCFRLELKKAANQKGLFNSLVADAGRTQIASGSRTVLGIGPGITFIKNTRHSLSNSSISRSSKSDRRSNRSFEVVLNKFNQNKKRLLNRQETVFNY